jgi:PAS domain S-box-containing protein
MAVWAVDHDGGVWQWALAAEQLLGWRPEEILGKDGLPLLVPECNHELAADLMRRTRAGETVVGAYPVRHRDGHLVDMEMWICPIADPQGRPGMTVIAAETSSVGECGTRWPLWKDCSASHRSAWHSSTRSCATCGSTAHSPT